MRLSIASIGLDRTEHGAGRKERIEDEAWMQDWPLEVADRDRVDEFIDLLTSVDDSDVAFVLMQLVLFSLDECDEERLEASWPKVAKVLSQDPLEHSQSLIYWARARQHSDGSWDLNINREEIFELTPRMQALLVQLKDAIGFTELRVD